MGGIIRMSLCDKEYGHETALKANQELPWQSAGASLTLKCHFKTEIYSFFIGNWT